MLRGLYSAASGMIAQRERLNVVANNIANVDTVGFKRNEVISRGFYQVFSEEVGRFPTVRGSMQTPGGGTALDATTHDFSPGSLMETENPLDIAIDGPGFFAVRTPAGERYTRAGNFSLTIEGQLITQDGHQVVGLQGPIFARGENVTIAPNGEVLVDGVPTERILVVDFPEPERLLKQGKNLYNADESVSRRRVTIERPELRVGMLERSNVNTVAELTSMIDAARNYESHQRVIRAFDQSLDTAVNEIARA